MVALAASSVVVVRFPFSDMSNSKLRPAVVLAGVDRGDWILCQVTSRPYADTDAIPLRNGDFAAGSLVLVSHARPGKRFTANESLIAAAVGSLTNDSFRQIMEAVVGILQNSLGR
jgi:mRNA interferase MazF